MKSTLFTRKQIETISGISAGKGLRTFLSTTALAAAGLVALYATPAKAIDDYTTPTGENVVGGSASFSRPSQGLLNIDQHGNRVVINWDSFNIGAKAKTEFFQPSSSSLAVNRVTGDHADPTQILGTLKANGRLMVLDRNGVFFGAGATIDVGGIIASTGDVDTAAVMSGADVFDVTGVGGSGSIVNNATINVADAGLAAFVAPTVVNNGIINAKLGKVALASGEKVTLDLYGDDLVEIAVSDKLADALIDNAGAINAEGGSVLITAQAAKEAVDNIINVSGIVDVSSATVKGGKIVLSGGEAGAVDVSGNLKANGTEGGDVSVTGQNILVSESANIEADGDTGGGSAIVFADGLAIVNGRMSARGGFVETSGLELAVGDTASVEAALWLLDPLSIVIGSGSGFISIPQPGNDPYYTLVSASAISTALSGGTNVTVQTGVSSTAGGANPANTFNHDEGDIRVRSDITKTGNSTATLSLVAHDDISIENNADITHGAGTGKLNVTLSAGNDGSGIITVNDDSTISTKGGNATFTATGGFISINQAMNLSGGNFLFNAGTDIDINAALATDGAGTVTLNAGDDISTGGDGTITTDGGSVSMTAGSGVNNNIFIDANIRTHGGAASFTAGGTFTVDNSSDLISTIGSDAPVTILASAFDLNGYIFAGSNTITIGRSTVGTIDVGDSNGSGFLISQGELDHMFAGNLVIGNANTTNVTVDDALMFAQFIQNDDQLPTPSQGCENSSGGNPNCANNFEMKDTNLTLKATSFVDIVGEGLTMGTGWVKVDAPRLDLDSKIYGKNTVAGTPFLLGDSRLIGTAQLATINVLSPNALIQQGVYFADDSTDLTTINVGAGTYNESVLVNKANVKLQGAPGFAATVDPNSPAFHITANDVTVTGFNISTGDDGVFIDNADNATIDGNTFSGQTANAVRVANGSDNATVTGNIIALGAAPGATGVNILGGSSHDVSSNIIGGAYNGVLVQNGTDVSVANNLIQYSDDDGVKISGGSNVSVTGNVIDSTDDDGISTANTANLTVSDNIITNVDEDGIDATGVTGASTISGNWIDGTNNQGIEVAGSDGLTVSGNAVHNVDDEGVKVFNSSNIGVTGNFLYGNNDETGVAVSGGSNVSVDGNLIDDFDTGVSMASVTGTNSVSGNTMTSVEYGVLANTVAGLTVAGNNISGNSVTGIDVDNSAGAVISGNTLDHFVTGIELTNSNGSNISSNTLTDVSGNNIYVGGSNSVTVDGNSATGGTNGVVIANSDDATVTGNTLSGQSGTGVYVYGGSASALVGVNTIASGSGATGIRIDGESDHDVQSNVINGGLYGILLAWTGGNNDVVGNWIGQTAGTSSNSIYIYQNTGSTYVGTNHVYNAGWDGINVNGNTGFVTVYNNDIHNTTGASGIAFVGGSTVGGLIDDNTIEDSARLGIYSDRTQNLTITRNAVTNSGMADIDGPFGPFKDGIFIEGGSNVTIGDLADASKGNTITGATGNGIRVGGGGNYAAAATTGIEIGNNKVGSTGAAGNIQGDGIHVEDSAGVQILANTVGNALGNGIFVDPSPATVIQGNTVSFVGADGIHLLDSDGSFIGGALAGQENKIDNVGDDGIEVVNSDDVQIRNNQIGLTGGYANIGDDGITVSQSDRAIIDGNAIDNADGRGISIFGGADHDVNNNTVTTVSYADGADEGIYAENTTGIDITDNHLWTVDNTAIKVVGGSNADVLHNDAHSSANDGIEINGVATALVDDNLIDGAYNGVKVQGGSNVTVTGNRIWGVVNGVWASLVSALWIDNNDIDHNKPVNDPAGGNIGIHVDGSSNVQIGSGAFPGNQGNTVDDFATGIEVSGNTGWTNIDGNDVTDVNTGIAAYATESLTVTDNNVDGRTGSGKGAGDGIHVEDSAYAVIGTFGHGNTVRDFNGTGVYVDPSPYAQVNYNNISGFGANGIHILDSDHVDVLGNTVYNNGTGTGIRIENSDDAEIGRGYNGGADRNTIHDVATGIVVNNGSDQTEIDNNYIYDVDYGIDANGVNTLNIFDNDIDAGGGRNSGEIGIKVVGGSALAIDSETEGFDGNRIDDFKTGIDVNGTNGVTIDDNTITDGNFGINTASVTNFLTITDNDIDAFSGSTSDAPGGTPGVDTAGIKIGNVDGTAVTVGGGYGNFGAGTSDGNRIDDFETGISVSGGDNVTVDNNRITDARLYGIFASDVDANGPWWDFTDGLKIVDNTVDGLYSGTRHGTGIHVEDSVNARIGGEDDGNIVTNVQTGIKAVSSKSVDVEHNEVENVDFNGIEIVDSKWADVENNNVTHIGGIAIFVDPSDYTTVSGNTIDYAANGVVVDNSDHVTVSGNFIGQASAAGIYGDGVRIQNGSDDATVSGNLIGVDGRGVSLLGGSGHTVSGNTINTVSWWNGSDEGVYAENTAESSISGNHITTADNAGIRVNGGSDATVDGNDIHGATEQGIDLYNVATASVTNNSVENTGSHGISANTVTGLTISGNWVGYADTAGTFGGSIYGNGINVIDSASAQIAGNHVRNTWGTGIFVDPSPYTLISGNVVSNFGTYGIQLLDSDYSSILGNTVTGDDSSETGIDVQNSSHVTIGSGWSDDSVNRNTVSNVGTGINVYNGESIEIDNNRVYNVDNGINVGAVDGLEITDNDVTGGHCGWGDGTGINVNNSSDVRIGGWHDGNDVDSFWRGIGVNGSYDVRIVKNDVWNVDEDGIHVEGGDDLLIKRNNVNDAGNNGIFVGYMYGDEEAYGDYGYEGGTVATIKDNDVGTDDYIGNNGIEVVDVVDSLIEGNHVGAYTEYGYSIGNNGILVTNEEEYDPTVIQNNVVLNVGNNGIEVDSVDVATISGNTIDVTGRDGIHVYDVETLTVSGNTISNTGNEVDWSFWWWWSSWNNDGDGIDVSNVGTASITGNTISNTGVDSPGWWWYGTNEADGISAHNVDTLDVSGNTITHTGSGVWGDWWINNNSHGINVGNVYQSTISGNTVSDIGGTGIYNDYGYTTTIANNTVDDVFNNGIEVRNVTHSLIEHNDVGLGEEGEGSHIGNDGILVMSGYYDDPTVIQFNHVMNAGHNGIEVDGVSDTTIHHNLVENSGNDGIHVEDVYESLIVSENTVHNSGYGDYGYGDGIEFDGVDNAHLLSNLITNSGANGFFASGPHNGYVELSGNTFTDNPVGAKFESGLIDLTGDTNFVNGGEIGLLFAPYQFESECEGKCLQYDDYYEGDGGSFADLNLVDDTIGTTTFEDQSDFYVYLDDNALWAPGFPTIIDGTDATYDGIHPQSTGNALTLGQYLQIESMIHDFQDENQRGLFFIGFVPNLAGVDPKDLFNQFDIFNPAGGGVNVTMTGLPFIGGGGTGGGLANALANIAPAAGGEQEDGASAEGLADIEPAAGGEGTQTNCWDDAANMAGTGQRVSFNFGTGLDEDLADAAGCQTSQTQF